MTLDDFYKLHGVNDRWLAKQTGYHFAHLNKVRRGKTPPSLKLLRSIAKATDNKVTFLDWQEVANES